MKPPPHVHLVAVPLGHAADLGGRAQAVLESARLIFCEDTRKFQHLAQELGLKIQGRLLSLPGDQEWETSWDEYQQEGEETPVWALVSDAGTPLVNDPGKALLEHARRRQWKVTAIPGPCAPILAWQWSGGFGLPFCFAGFAPKVRSPGVKALQDFFEGLEGPRTFVFFDTRHQVLTTLAHLEEAGMGHRRLYVARDMTKPHEELLQGEIHQVRAELEKRLHAEKGVGELTLVLEGSGPTAPPAQQVGLADLTEIRQGGSKKAAKIAARLTGLSVSECYASFHRAAED